MPIYSHRELTTSQTINCDVCIIGSGAGGGMLAEGLAQAGVDVVMLEAGEHRTQKTSNMDEGVAFARLYQEGGLRATDDLSITILQGECVGGTTTINWTTCFRTPEPILELWRHRYGLTELTPENLTPHFSAVEERLNISEWPQELANANNQIIFRGCKTLGKSTPQAQCQRLRQLGLLQHGLSRQRQAGHAHHTIPAAVEAGMRLYTNTAGADVLVQKNNRIDSILRKRLGSRDPPQNRNHAHHSAPRLPSPPVVQSMAQPSFCVLESTTTSAWMRTFIHPVVALGAVFDEAINGFYGAPQSASTHHFFDRGATEIWLFHRSGPHTSHACRHSRLKVWGRLTVFYGQAQPHGLSDCHHDDGIIEGDDGGQVALRNDGRLSIQYPI